jgi:DNA-binding NarL/FixJ family response regulator
MRGHDPVDRQDGRGGGSVRRVLIIAAGVGEAEALRRALQYAGHCQVMGYADIRRPCGDVVAEARPDVVLVDDAGTPQVTLGRLREARGAAPEATIVCRTNHVDPSWPNAAADAGADATVDLGIEAARMGLLVREIADGTVFSLPRSLRRAAPLTTSSDAKLTARESEILQLMAAGATNSSVARQLWVTEQTVKFHLSNIYRKLGVANRTEASHYAYTHGLLDPMPGRAADSAIGREAAAA